MKRMMFILILGTLLTGCGKRELEDRIFPTVLTSVDADMKKQEQDKQDDSSKYIDYGHVKAVILSDEVIKDAKSLKEVLLYFEENPYFARNILMFIGDKEVIEIANQNEGETGLYLEDLIKNKPDDQKPQETLLKDMLNYLHNRESALTIPKLKAENGEILPDETAQITQDVAPVMNVPIPRKTSR